MLQAFLVRSDLLTAGHAFIIGRQAFCFMLYKESCPWWSPRSYNWYRIWQESVSKNPLHNWPTTALWAQFKMLCFYTHIVQKAAGLENKYRTNKSHFSFYAPDKINIDKNWQPPPKSTHLLMRLCQQSVCCIQQRGRQSQGQPQLPQWVSDLH